MVDVDHAFDKVLVATDDTTMIIATTDREVIVEHPRPRGPRPTKKTAPSPKS